MKPPTLFMRTHLRLRFIAENIIGKIIHHRRSNNSCNLGQVICKFCNSYRAYYIHFSNLRLHQQNRIPENGTPFVDGVESRRLFCLISINFPWNACVCNFVILTILSPPFPLFVCVKFIIIIIIITIIIINVDFFE